MRVLDKLHRDEFPELRATIEAKPVPVRKPFRPAYPGVSATALAELRAAAADPSPAERAALNVLAGPTRGVPTALLRTVHIATVPVDDIETVAADVVRLAAGAAYVPLPIRIRLAAIAEQMAEVDAR